MRIAVRFVRLGTFVAAVSLAAGAATTAADQPPLEVFAVSDLVRVFEDGYGNPDRKLVDMSVFGLRGETISAQFALAAREELKELTVSISPLKMTGRSAAIPVGNVEWNFVEGIRIEQNTPKLLKSDLIRPAPAWFPDCLSDKRTVSVPRGSLRAVYLTIKIPSDAEAGEYRADVTSSSGSARVSLPLLLTVYPLRLPDQRHVMATLWFNYSNRILKLHGIDPKDADGLLDLLRAYAKDMADHRQNVFRINFDTVENIRTAEGKLMYDWSLFDRWAQVFWETGRMDLLETGFLAHFGKAGWRGREVVLRDFPVKDESTGKVQQLPGKEFLPQFLPAFVAHLREKGWLNKTVLHISDEPSDHNVMPWREASDFIHRYAPELRRLDAIESPHFLDRLEIWVPKLDHLATWQSAYEEAQRKGYEIWYYTVGIFQKGSLPNKTVDVPLIEARVMHWLNYRFGLLGYLHWGYNQWSEDPYKDPGTHRGDGWHVYPKRGGVLDSLRWEQMRNGLQDYECLWLLQDKVTQIKAGLSSRVADLIQPSRRGVEIASQVVQAYNNFTRDPAVLYAARRQAIEEILDLDKSPRIILQTNPPEHSQVANDSAIDVHGWAEPGTILKVNGQAIPVDPDGLFLEQLPPSKEGTIVLEAENTKARKTIIRSVNSS